MILSSPRRQVASAVLNHSAKEQFLPLQAHLYFHNGLNPAVKNIHLQLTTNYYRKPMTKKTNKISFHLFFSVSVEEINNFLTDTTVGIRATNMCYSC